MNKFTNSNLRTFAIVEAQLTKKLMRPTDYLIPFFQASIGAFNGKQFSVKDIVKYIKRHYSIDIPIYLAESLIPKLERIGSLEKQVEFNCYLCRRNEFKETEVYLNQSHFDLIDNRLDAFSKRYKIKKPLDSKNWQKALLRFFEQSNGKHENVIVNGKKINNPKALDDRLISKFIIEIQSSDPKLFEVIKKIYSAYAIVDTVISIQNISHDNNWDNLKIIYDSTVLMRILGTSGSFMKEATLEMHNRLISIGCKICYFDHNLNEVINNIQAIISKISRNKAVYSETAKAFEDNELSLAILNLMIGDIEKRLGNNDINELTLPDRLTNVTGQINPTSLKDFLTNKIKYKSYSDAPQVDADSVEKILFLRKGNKSIELPKSEFVFVTHNSNYAKYSKEYCQEHCDYKHNHTPPVVTLGLLTRLAWLSSNNGSSKIDITNELLINCFQASLPDEKWIGKFWKTIELSNPEVLNIDTHESLYLIEIRKTAEDISLGSDVFLEDMDIPGLIKKAKAIITDKEKLHDDQIVQLTNKNINTVNDFNHEKEKLKMELFKESEKKLKQQEKEFNEKKEKEIEIAIKKTQSINKERIINKSIKSMQE